MLAHTGGSKRTIIGIGPTGYDSGKPAHAFFVLQLPSGYEACCACAAQKPARKYATAEEVL